MSPVPQFPLSAVVGSEPLKLALCLAAIDPRIAGVLIEGPRGMAKSTLARGISDLLDNAAFVTLPLGATEERLLGTLDLERVLAAGHVHFSPGLLAKAHGGVLYVDEVNLLPDALVDLLLDVAASGINHVERDGVSHQHPARFVLIGTMNTEEGPLRPQLLDRFGLSVALEQRPTPEQRAEIIRRRLAFDQDPVAFVQAWAEVQAALYQRCQDARHRLAQIPLDDASLAHITERCFALEVEGVRADLVWLRAARAHAVWMQRAQITTEDIEVVADFVLRHRVQNHQSAAQSPTEQSQAQSPSNTAQTPQNAQESGESGDWGTLAPEPQALGIRREPPRWSKKP